MNLKLRFKNPTFVINLLIGAILLILGYFSLTPEDLTTWQKLADLGLQFVSNPFLIFSVIWYLYMAVMDPTTPGTGDSAVAMAKISVKDTAQDVVKKIEEKEAVDAARKRG
ncbi:MAG: phage holin [Eubacterium sp.]